jgi:hypothetical protein
MIRKIGVLVVGMAFAASVGCGGGTPEPAKTTPELSKEAKESMEKASGGGGGPEMIRKMNEERQTKPQ